MTTQEKYKITVQMTGYDMSRHSMAVGYLTVLSPEGEIVGKYPYRSGGYGKGALPGMWGELNTSEDGVAAVYNIGGGVIKNNGAFVKGGKDGYEYEEGKGFFIGLHNEYVRKKLGRDGFQIHPDGGVVGTMGCVGITKDVAEDFQKLWISIPKNQRPDQLIVLKPDAELAAINLDIEKNSKYIIPEKRLLLLFGSNGEEVENLQKFLKSQGLYSAEIDPEFGKKTKQAVIEFQKAHGLKVDGIVGPETFGKMLEIQQKDLGQDVVVGKRVNVDKELLSNIGNWANTKFDDDSSVQDHKSKKTTSKNSAPQHS